MANMTYCMMQNTLGDLEQVMNALEEGAVLSSEEMNAYEGIKQLCEDFANMPEPTDENEESACIECGMEVCEC